MNKKTIYTDPEMRVIRVREDIVCTSMPDGVHNEYQPGEGLAPQRNSIWN